MLLSASSARGVIESDDDAFCLGVQFLPEHLICGDIEDGFVSSRDIRSLTKLEKEQKERSLMFHQKNTDALINTSAGQGHLKLG